MMDKRIMKFFGYRIGELDTTEKDWVGYAAAVGCHIIRPKDNQLFIDIDNKIDYEYFLSQVDTLTQAKVPISYEVTPSKSGLPNRHIIVSLEKPICDWQRIAMQFMLGSDTKRETWNTHRKLRGGDVGNIFFEPNK
jgi:hypothetical protein